ncbi:alpha-2-macroglobulin family protein [Dinghuibacter silviterrae]|uniref:MG2 domain-containing protein n=1 Tax=Dinghuibacter silviterrae TaxID=1539049 RepID=A0A4V3GLD7_9BACT|nr:alpha-2-macroglobulin family protein [Dinghuibacter silviterrae]TDW99172.1 MG2 domain-containing protein [Dinghuibacter silviterrae]
MLTHLRSALLLGLLLAATASSAQTSYDQAWKQVDRLADTLDRPKDALALVQDLYTRARREHNQPQAIRALLYTVRIDQPLTENADSSAIHLLETSIDSFPQPYRAILQSLTAQAYWNFLQTHRFQVTDVSQRIDSLFSASLQDTLRLGRTPLSEVGPVLDKGNDRKLRPTLLDLLTNRAIRFYSSQETRFSPDTVLFAGASVFMTHTFQTPDKALRLYQALLRFHARDAQPDAFADADIHRLDFARQASSLDDADDRYEGALRHLCALYLHREAGAMPLYLLAQWLRQQGSAYTPGAPDTSRRWQLNEALALCDALVSTFPSSTAGRGARLLAREIRQPELDVLTGRVNLPNHSILASVGFTNCPLLHLRLLRVTASVTQTLRDGKPQDLDSVRPFRTWTQRLPDPHDHQPHRTEIALPALPTGDYVLLTATNDRFGKDSLVMHALPFTVSGIAWIETGTYSFFVLDRESGEPLAGARVHLWNTRAGKVEDYVTDSDGHFRWDGKLNTGTLRMQIRYGDDSLTVDNGDLLTPVRVRDAAPAARFAFYTDRSVYRPGQTVFFKAIGMIRDTAARREVPYRPGKAVPFYLESLGLKIDSLWLEPGEYGSVHGHFVLPSAGRTGIYTITAAQSQTNVTVEEYKRPKYEVTFVKPIREYRLGDTLDVTGSAMAYAGNPVSGAKVSYTVSRYAYYPVRWDRPSFGPIRRPSATTLIRDSTQTGPDGSFLIHFPLEPGPGIRKDLDPTFTYTVNADVTDINGETHSATFTLQAAYHSLILSLKLPNAVNADSLVKMDIQCTNLSGTPRPTLALVTISRLTPPERLTHDRLWAAPDVFTLPEDTFHRLFPHDPYGQESDRGRWPVAETVQRYKFKTGKGPVTPLWKGSLPSGVYKVEVSATDPEGRTVTTGSFLEVYNPREARVPYPTYAWTMSGNLQGKDSVTYFAGTAGGPRFAIQQVSAGGHIHIKHIRLSPEVTTLSFPQGASSFGLAYVAGNRVYTTVVTLPARKKALSIHYDTFRDKLEPGSAEHLSLSVRGPEHEAVEAEVLASMYDASLDQFAPNTWSLPVLAETGRGPVWRAYGFETGYGVRSQNRFGYQPPVLPVYDDFPGPRLLRNDKLLQWNLMKEKFAPLPENYHFSLREDRVTIGYGTSGQPPAPLVPLRKDFNETAFFYPDLHTDSAGRLSFTFTLPDALTRWALQTLAHTRDLVFGLDQQTQVTQKTLMVQPNIPRFLREGDDAWLSTKVVNTGDRPLDGRASLVVLDALDMQPVQGLGGDQPFSLQAGSDTALRFHLAIPVRFTHPLVYRLTAAAGDYSDGEQGPIPVLNRRILLTETYPLTPVIQVTPLLQNISPYRLTLEYTANPVWYVLRALPYLEGTENACPQTVAERLYTNTLGEGLLQRLPDIQKSLPAMAADSSPLYKDTELKNALLEETPWVLDAGKETASIQRLSAFLDTGRLSHNQKDALHTLETQQFPSGAFPWFEGGAESRYATQYILTLFGKLSSMGLTVPGSAPLIRKALNYLDARLRADGKKTEEDLHYLYARGFFKDFPPDSATRAALDTCLQQAAAGWVHASLYDQALIALASDRWGDTATANNILVSLEQRSILSPDRGRYWKENDGGWSWTQAPVETQALLITAFSTAHKDPVFIDQLCAWLLAQKQTQAWPTGPATADACYALLINQSAEAAKSPVLTARLGDVRMDQKTGPGLFKQQWEGNALTPSMGNIQVHVKDAPHGWGAVYYQYFRDLDSVGNAQTTVSVQKQLFVLKGATMRALNDGDAIHLGDRVRIRLVLRSDRPLEFVHLKDLRPACLEPVDTRSGYRFGNGLSYYLSPRDLSTSFFFDWLPKGTSVLEYDQFVNMEGTFSGGMATLESFYAPQCSARSAGVSLRAIP